MYLHASTPLMIGVTLTHMHCDRPRCTLFRQLHPHTADAHRLMTSTVHRHQQTHMEEDSRKIANTHACDT